MKAELVAEDGTTAEGEEAEGGEESDAGHVSVEYIPLDLSSFQSTIDCVRAFKEKNLPLHILINNAAIAFTPYSEW
jgi:short-subunit dehydrogenase